MRLLRNASVGVACALLVAAAACEDTRAITTDHVGPLGFGITMQKQSTNIRAGFIRMPPSPVATATPVQDSIRVRVAGLDSLATGTYTVWLTNDSATKFALVTSGNLTITQTDTSLNAAGDRVVAVTTSNRAGVSGWKAGGSNKAFVFRTSRASSTIAATDSLGVVVVSIETAAPGTAPGENRVVWGRRSERTGDSTTIRFGTFKPRLAEQFIYTTNSAMTIVPRGRVEVRGPILVMNDSNYFRPPVGYYYAAFALKQDSLNKVTDTVYLGRRTTPYPGYVSLYGVDKTNPDPVNVFDVPPVIYAMGTRAAADTIPKARQGSEFWRDFALVHVTLESRFAEEGKMGPALVLSAILPSSVRGR